MVEPARRVTSFLVAAAVAAVALVVVYVFFVRTYPGQRFDDVAFDGRRVADPTITKRTDELLHRVTRSSLFLLTAAIVVLALARRRVRLAVVAGAAITASVVTTELLKLRILDRPALEGIAGFEQNSFPSGHATIGMALSLGFVLVTPHSSRWLAALVAIGVAVFFGIGVLATGWHRPSDTVGAYLVCIVWFALAAALLLRWRGAGNVEMGEVEEALGPSATALLGVLVLAAVATGLAFTLSAESLRTVEFAVEYLAVCVGVLALAVAIVLWYFAALRGISLDAPDSEDELAGAAWDASTGERLR